MTYVLATRASAFCLALAAAGVLISAPALAQRRPLPTPPRCMDGFTRTNTAGGDFTCTSRMLTCSALPALPSGFFPTNPHFDEAARRFTYMCIQAPG
jgi:hypothetical protein